MEILRRLFVVPLADNDHGKSHLVRGLLAQGSGRPIPINRPRGPVVLQSPWGRSINALVYGRSFQESEVNAHGTVERSLTAVDPEWRTRDLIILPSHLVRADVRQMVRLAHHNGFDAISVAILLNNQERQDYEDCWRVSWDERWNLPNPEVEDRWEEQVRALASDLWTRICEALGS